MRLGFKIAFSNTFPQKHHSPNYSYFYNIKSPKLTNLEIGATL